MCANKNRSSFKRLSILEYKQLCQKGSQENYIFDKLVARKISIFITIPMIWIGMRPNQATLLSLISLLSSFYFFIYNTSAMLLTGSFLVLLYYLLDHVDGELARYYSKTESNRKNSQDGQYFDVLCHCFSGNIIVFLFGISAYKNFGYEWAVLAAFTISVGMNRFPEKTANKIMINVLSTQPKKPFKESVYKVLNILAMKQDQIVSVQAPITDPAKWLKIIKEMLGFPGILIMIMFVALLDAIFPDFLLFSFSMNFRLLLILLLLPIELLRTTVSSIKYFNLFKTIV